jgi:hypothetical protein
MTDENEHPGTDPDPGHPAADTVSEQSPTAGEASLEKGDVEWSPSGGRGGDHPTHGAGEHDDPSN